ncbi:MAG: hypothetical protein ACRC8M_01555 [Cetobacterium sp.]|uniref:hypothetical protein n=1 Tax=Cetobacterium sp. TaxID=2071632 RepID=UPI003F338951
MFDSDLKKFLKNILNLDFEGDFIFIKDSNFKYVFANSKFCELFKICPEDIAGKDDTFLTNDEKFLRTCHESDLAALKENHVICTERAFNTEFNVLKMKIATGPNNFGILGFAKLSMKKR